MDSVFLGITALIVIFAIIVIASMYLKSKKTYKVHPNKVSSSTNKENTRTIYQPITNKIDTASVSKNTQVAPKPTNTIDERERKLYQNLLKKSLGDKAKVERLIQLEAKKAPHSTRVEWLRNAIDQWEQDNR